MKRRRISRRFGSQPRAEPTALDTFTPSSAAPSDQSKKNPSEVEIRVESASSEESAAEEEKCDQNETSKLPPNELLTRRINFANESAPKSAIKSVSFI